MPHCHEPVHDWQHNSMRGTIRDGQASQRTSARTCKAHKRHLLGERSELSRTRAVARDKACAAPFAACITTNGQQASTAAAGDHDRIASFCTGLFPPGPHGKPQRSSETTDRRVSSVPFASRSIANPSRGSDHLLWAWLAVSRGRVCDKRVQVRRLSLHRCATLIGQLDAVHFYF